MIWNELLIRYGEMSLKGRNRKVFIQKLTTNIKHVLHDLPSVKLKAERDRMFLYATSEDLELAIERLTDVAGIQSYSPIAKCESTVEAIQQTALAIFETEDTEEKTFKVEVRRTDKSFPLITGELQREIGGTILKAHSNLRVNVKKPDILLHIDIREGGSFLSSKVFKGAGGMPVGSNGKSLLMLSGGIDSPVAGYLMMKRGVTIEAIHFASPPFTSEQAQEKVVELGRKISAFGGNIKLHVIPFTEIQQAIVKQVPDNVSITSTRRIMLRIADQLRVEIGALAIVTGESLGQVASQTLESFTAINAVTSTPILRPLIATDKLEIIDIAKRIGTYDTSIQPFEDCCTVFTPSSPKTKPRLEKVEYYESFIDFEPIIAEAIQNRKVIDCSIEEKTDEFIDLL
ncbi:tRNA uracil 4-sulfurtransferase ThiI [Sporosarcina gallistercoris]|uniref:Probable tRNA sulfurtransferase n=1 Tax=Sporosarcina gallistercoris TaxID=2762245 RepID=A0ABR8PIC7_9BACL|nr:tRNA uracil 4-sulfurtransferase ThiI [Sporosarcina gallistercoris]MBD7907920.1 tRNA 4-thiouridine(8) synthase ThiI [Sporosarcina gallistercoris]